MMKCRLALGIKIAIGIGWSSTLLAEGISFNIAAMLKEEKSRRAQLEKSIGTSTMTTALSQLRTFLDDNNYNTAAKKLMGAQYKVTPPSDISYGLELDKTVKDERQKLLLRLFMLRGRLSEEDLKRLFPTAQDEQRLISLIRNNILLRGKDGRVEMNNIRIIPYEIKSSEGTTSPNPMYIFEDSGGLLPQQYVSTTSQITLGKIETLPPTSMRGIGADFGSGVGIQAIALLKTQPLSKVYGLEVDSHAIALSKLNATFNQVQDRFEAIENKDPNLLTQKLNGQKLEIAVSNPPFNIVPEGFHLDDYGGGGPKGLDITKIFLSQVKTNLKEGGQFVFYSQLARDKDSNYFLESLAKEILGAGFEIQIAQCDFPANKLSRNVYADAISKLLKKDPEATKASTAPAKDSPPPKAVPTDKAFQKIKPMRKLNLTLTKEERLFEGIRTSMESEGIVDVIPAIVTIRRNTSSRISITKPDATRNCAGQTIGDILGPYRNAPPGSTAK